MKSGYFTKILNGNVAGPNEINHLNGVQNQGYIHVKFFCVYSGIIKEYSILNFYLVVIPLIQTKYCTQLEKLREAKKRPGIVNRSNVIFHHDNARPHVAKGVIKNCLNLIRKFYHIPHIPQTLPHLITTCSEHYNTF